MSADANPYQSPQAEADPVQPLVSQGGLTEKMLVSLKEASPWLRFVGIVGFVSAGLWFLLGLVYSLLIPLIWAETNVAIAGAIGAVFGGSMAVLSIGVGVLVFFPSLYIYRFGEKIRNYLRTGMDQDLELAFRNNKSLWKFAGIICIISMAFTPVIIVGSIIAAVASAL